ncbi:MAG: PilZ domain-containing protein [Myxococcota bacterium]
MDSDKRRFKRVRIPLLVQYRFSPLGEFRTDYAVNVSEGGLFISNAEAVPEGSVVFLQFLTREGMHLISGEGRVVRNGRDGGQGVQFIRLDPADLERLHELIDRVERQRG